MSASSDNNNGRRTSTIEEFPNIKLPVLKVRRASILETSAMPETVLPEISESGSRKSSISLVGRANDFRAMKPGMRRMSTKRPSLATYGRRVSTILGMRRLSVKQPQVEEENPMQTIKELPKEARFSTTFSDEAQFAMLKGYEDVLHSELSFSFPEHRGLLLRNSTPGFPVRVKKSSTSTAEQPAESETLTEEEKGPEPQAPPEPEDDYDIWEQEWLTPSKQDRRHSVLSGNGAGKALSESGMKRAKSLPYISKSRSQLVLTHRFQSAIDILDSIRKALGYSTISPRVNDAVIAPVRDFNFWTSAWYSEFTKASS